MESFIVISPDGSITTYSDDIVSLLKKHNTQSVMEIQNCEYMSFHDIDIVKKRKCTENTDQPVKITKRNDDLQSNDIITEQKIAVQIEDNKHIEDVVQIDDIKQPEEDGQSDIIDRIINTAKQQNAIQNVSKSKKTIIRQHNSRMTFKEPIHYIDERYEHSTISFIVAAITYMVTNMCATEIVMPLALNTNTNRYPDRNVIIKGINAFIKEHPYLRYTLSNIRKIDIHEVAHLLTFRRLDKADREIRYKSYSYEVGTITYVKDILDDLVYNVEYLLNDAKINTTAKCGDYIKIKIICKNDERTDIRNTLDNAFNDYDVNVSPFKNNNYHIVMCRIL